MEQARSGEATAGVAIREAKLAEILPLREAVLIAGTDRPSPDFPGDEASSTIHVGAFVGDEAVGCLTWIGNDWEGEPAFQLRGMAVAPAFQRRGIGTQLLREAEAMLQARHRPGRVWCYARVDAMTFYAREGWQGVGEPFVISGVGPHSRMIKIFP